MSISRRKFVAASSAAILLQRAQLFAYSQTGPHPGATSHETVPDFVMPAFEPVQPELFSAAGAQPNCWADFDADGDLDLFVGFKAGLPNRLYRNDSGKFYEVSAQWGIADLTDTRAAAWGDFDSDGKLDLYVGFTRKSGVRNKLYRNDGAKFVDVAHDIGVDVVGETRQVSFIDFDNDGRIDIFVAFRDARTCSSTTKAIALSM